MWLVVVCLEHVFVADLLVSLGDPIRCHAVHLDVLCALFEVTALHLGLGGGVSVLYSCCLCVEVVLASRVHHFFFLARVDANLEMMGIETGDRNCIAVILLYFRRVWVLGIAKLWLLVAPWRLTLVLMSLNALQMRSVLTLSYLWRQVSKFACVAEQGKVIVCLTLHCSLFACCQNLAA